MFIIAILIVGVVLIVMTMNSGNAVRRSGRTLHNAVIALGDVTQHDYASITKVLGDPSSLSNMPGGITFAQWIRPGYHIAMSFDKDDKCVGIDHEVAV